MKENNKLLLFSFFLNFIWKVIERVKFVERKLMQILQIEIN